MEPKKNIEQVLHEHRDEITELPGVVGIAQGECSGYPCIKVYTSERKDELRWKIPAEIEGFPVDIEVTGSIQAL